MTLSLARVVAEYAAGRTVNLAALAKFEFATGAQCVWGGEYDMTDPTGQVWTGLGAPPHLISIDGLEQAMTLEAAQLKITMSGADAAMMRIAASESRADYVNRLLIVYGLFCDANWQPLAEPMALAAGLMGSIQINKTETKDGWTRSIAIPADNIFYGRGSPPAAFYTDADQQQRFPGDMGLSFIPSLQATSIPVPWH